MINQYAFIANQNELAGLQSLGPGGVKVVNLESPSAAGARLASRPGMSGSNWADVTATPSDASRVAFNMMLVTIRRRMKSKEHRYCWAEWPLQVYKWSTQPRFICHSNDDAVHPVRPPSLGCIAQAVKGFL